MLAMSDEIAAMRALPPGPGFDPGVPAVVATVLGPTPMEDAALARASSGQMHATMALVHAYFSYSRAPSAAGLTRLDDTTRALYCARERAGCVGSA